VVTKVGGGNLLAYKQDLTFDLNIVASHPIDSATVLSDPTTGGLAAIGGSVDSVGFSNVYDVNPQTVTFSLAQIFTSTFDANATYSSGDTITNLRMDLTGVPEPAALGLLAMGMGMTMLLRPGRRWIGQ